MVTANILARAIEVLGTRPQAERWLSTPNRALGGVTPAELLQTPEGILQVQRVLTAIEHGLPV